MLKRLLIVGAVAATAAAQAQTTDAARYTNSQGVEIIQNRPPPAAALPTTAPAREAPVKPVSVPQPKVAAENPAVRDARFQVSPQDQNARDRDRLNILRQELVKELEGYEAKNKVLRSPTMKAGLDEQQLKRLQETLQAHERNIRDLNAEISRTSRQ
jgi:hypothetical protein